MSIPIHITPDLKVPYIGNLTTQPTSHLSLLNDAFDWWTQHAQNLPAPGEYEIKGRDLRVHVQHVRTKSQLDILKERGFEAHQKEADIHVCVEGNEIIQWTPTTSLQIQQAYDAVKDYALYEAPTKPQEIIVQPNDFVVLLPQHAHVPGIHNQSKNTTKLVFKLNLKRLFTQ